MSIKNDIKYMNDKIKYLQDELSDKIIDERNMLFGKLRPSLRAEVEEIKKHLGINIVASKPSAFVSVVKVKKGK